MSYLIEFVKKLLNRLFSTRAAGMYMLLFAIAIGAATFIENDFGTSAAQKVVFKSIWFTLLLILFAITITVNIIRFRMVPQKKWALFTFHASIIIILIGSGVTRYFGYEGIMHIRENNASNSFLSSETYLKFTLIKNQQVYQFDEEVLFASLGNNGWNESYLVDNDLIEIKVIDFIPNPLRILSDSPEGAPTIKVVFGGSSGREEYYIRQGEQKRVRNVIFNFSEQAIPQSFQIIYRNDSLLFLPNTLMTQTVMATQKTDTIYPNSGFQSLKLRALYSDGLNSFVFGDFKEKGSISIESESVKIESQSIAALKLEVKVNDIADEIYVYGQKGMEGRPSKKEINNLNLSIAYGAKEKALPFHIKLYDFIMERYPGTDNPTSFASEVQLIDARTNVKEDHRIYMNHVLDHDGYRFFQSSYDKDELGTYLSVNHDFWGTWISYIGYILLTLGMIFSLLSKKSRFFKVSQKIRELRKQNKTFLILFVLVFSVPSYTSAQKVIDLKQSHNIIDIDHANKFSNLVVQDHRGRMKPLHTLNREVMRKLAKAESLNGLTADQIILGMFANSEDWINEPLIKLGKHEAIKKRLNVADKLISYSKFFGNEGEYLLKDEVRRAYNLNPIDRGVYEKELMKIDEKVNIANMVFSGHIFKIVPVPDDPNNTWVAGNISSHNHDDSQHQPIADQFFSAYRLALKKAMSSNDYTEPNLLLNELVAYQKAKGFAVLPSASEISAEILLNKLNVFGRLSVLYVILGLTFLFLLFFSVFKPDVNLKTLYTFLITILLLGFIFHTVGLGLRWYVSGRAPWSNGYESMIYIAWTTVLAGVLFTRKSFGGLAATMILSATVLLVASLSYLDPEITPLVPVLRSYWLTIHVSLEAGSYGFLMLGAVIGLINLILMIFLSNNNQKRIHRMIQEMSLLSEMTLIGGLFMISVGTYLGGVWANESWGRYWGWDAKETWALVTILVYAFILHMRLIPKLKGLFAFNFASIFGLASVIMTYYGVNYYLSGLHSYASGDPVPIPQWVYILVIVILTISIAAFLRKRKFKIIT